MSSGTSQYHAENGHVPYRAYNDISLPPINLPPIRSVDDHIHHHHHTQEIHNLPPIEPPIAGGANAPTSYYTHPAPTPQYPLPQPSLQESALNQHMRYPAPPDYNASGAADAAAANRQKKDIKRRTKTGCLTCRKRRIKCDETQPACRNCQKSKRECRYDPIFKQQPAASNPAPTSPSVPVSRSSTAASTPRSPTFSPSPRSHVIATTQAQSPLQNTSNNVFKNTDAQHAIDPALGTAHPSATRPLEPQPSPLRIESTNHNAGVKHEPSNPTISSLLLNDKQHHAVKTEAVADNDMLSHTSNPIALSHSTMTIAELCMIGGIRPSTPRMSKPITSDMHKDIEYLYLTEYAQGIDLFLETSWYQSRGFHYLQADSDLYDLFAGTLECFSATKSNDHDAMRILPSTEARMIWTLMCLPRRLTASNSHYTMPPDDAGLQTILDRLSILEALLTGTKLSQPLTCLASADHQDLRSPPARQLDFWRRLSDFAAHVAPADALAHMRRLLDERENRDVLYSVAVVRHLGTGGAQLGEADRTRLDVAQRFVEDEAAGRGTTQVAQRICGMAVRGWGMGR